MNGTHVNALKNLLDINLINLNLERILSVIICLKVINNKEL